MHIEGNIIKPLKEPFKGETMLKDLTHTISFTKS
jgi:hypothetical protein